MDGLIHTLGKKLRARGYARLMFPRTNTEPKTESLKIDVARAIAITITMIFF